MNRSFPGASQQYSDEMQLRERFREFARINCYNPESCRGNCGVLPGDTIVWDFRDDGRREMKRYQPASKEELQERGWLCTHAECSDDKECFALLEEFAVSFRERVTEEISDFHFDEGSAEG